MEVACLWYLKCWFLPTTRTRKEEEEEEDDDDHHHHHKIDKNINSLHFRR
jgi:hypothetical protein